MVIYRQQNECVSESFYRCLVFWCLMPREHFLGQQNSNEIR